MSEDRKYLPMKHPISYYEDGKWIFVEEFYGDYLETLKRLEYLTLMDRGRDKFSKREYRIWDDR